MHVVLRVIVCGLIVGLLTPFWGGLTGQEPSAFAAGSSDTAESLALPVPRTFELTHVRPEHFAVALGKDPARIFAFVRDQIAYEVYTGYLRGPRGTLLALAGNSVDQAALLGSMLEHAGQQVRYVRGELPKAEAEKLVNSMWAERSRPAESEPRLETSSEIEAALETLRNRVEQDHKLILDHLKGVRHTPGPGAAISLPTLVEEAQSHYRVQWLKNGVWVDLDPSFDEASIGVAFTGAGGPFETFPEQLFHRVEIRVRLEEYADDQPSSRVILKHATTAAELSGLDFGLVHMPENWTGPADSLQAALESAIADTGKIRPVLFITEQGWIPGEPFYQRPPPSRGLGSVFAQLRGEGTRKAVPIATAEQLEIDLISPDGRKETVIRDIFDHIGVARRKSGQPMSVEDVRALSHGPKSFDAEMAYYDVLVTTGHIAWQHLPGKADEGTSLFDPEFPDLLAILRQVNINLTTMLDAWLRRLEWPGGRVVRFYPDAPRLVVTDLGFDGDAARATIDLRRTRPRMAARNLEPAQSVAVNVYRGVVEGASEQMIMDLIVSRMSQDHGFRQRAGTSALFARTRAERVPLVLLQDSASAVELGDLRNAHARLEGDLARGMIAVAPRRAVMIDGVPQLAWWRIDPATGETIAVGGDGLHQNTVEVYVQHRRNEGRTVVTSRVYVDGQLVRSPTINYSRLPNMPTVEAVYGPQGPRGFAGGVFELNRDLQIMRGIGARVITGAPPPLL